MRKVVESLREKGVSKTFDGCFVILKVPVKPKETSVNTKNTKKKSIRKSIVFLKVSEFHYLSFKIDSKIMIVL